MEDHGKNQQRHNSLGQHPNRRHEIIRSPLQSPVLCTCTYPKLCTDHPILVYKTYESEQTVLRLFSCLPPQSWIPSPLLWSPLLQSPFLLYPSSCLTSHLCSFGSVTSNSKPLLTLTATKSSESLTPTQVCLGDWFEGYQPKWGV